METKPYSLQAPEQIAKEYGGNKRAIAQASQQGLLDPTAAILDGMFIDRMRNAAAMEQSPAQTVAQDVMAPPQPQMGMPSQPSMGLADVPIPENMYEPSYAGGGIVAFQSGGPIQKFQFGGSASDPMFEANIFGTYEGFEYPSLSDEEKLKYLQGRIGYPQAAALREGKITLDQLFKQYYTPPARPKAVSTAPATPAADQMPADVASGAFVDKALADRGIRYEGQPTPAKTKPAAVAPAATPTIAAPKEKTFAEFQAEMAAAGINDNVAKKIAELQAKMGDTKAEREEAKNMAILQAGLGIMGGTSPYALKNIAEGAQSAITQYGASMKDIKAAERDADKLGVELAKAEDARKRGDFEAYQKHIDKAKDLEFKLRDLELKGRQVGAQELSAQAQMESARRPAGVTTLEAARLRTRAAINAAAQEMFAPGGDLRKQYNDRVKKDGQEAADRWKQATIRQYVRDQEAMLPELGGSSLGGSSDVTSDPLGLRGGR